MMSQMFDENAKVLPFTSLALDSLDQLVHFESFSFSDPIKVIGFAKGKGFTGVMKRWGFSGGPESHGQKNKHRAPGSIGAQGQGRVMPGKKMAGRKGGEKIVLDSKFLSLDKNLGVVNIKGCVPGSRNCVVYIYILKKDS